MTRRKPYARLAGGLCVFLSTIAMMHAQGTVTFINDASTLVRWHSGCFDGRAVNPGEFTIGLWWGVEGTTEESALSLIATTEIVAPGRFVGGVVTTPPATPGGAMAVFQIRTWLSVYPSFEAALAGVGGVGWTGLWTQITGNATPIDLPKAILPPVGGFTGLDNIGPLSPPCVPEPSTVSLSLLAVVALILWHGRRTPHDRSENTLH